MAELSTQIYTHTRPFANYMLGYVIDDHFQLQRQMASLPPASPLPQGRRLASSQSCWMPAARLKRMGRKMQQPAQNLQHVT